MGNGIQTGWSDPTDPNYVPSGSDFLRIFNDIKSIAVPPFGRFLRYDTDLVPDSTWHACRVNVAQYDVDAQTGYLQPTLHSAPGTVVDTFTINTIGFYLLLCRERYSGLANGEHGMQWVIVGGSPLCQTFQTIVPLHVQTNVCWTVHPLTAGQQVQCQHSYNGFGDNRNLTLYTDSPTPEVLIVKLGETALH